MNAGKNRDTVRLALTVLTVPEGIGAVPLCCTAPFSIFGFDKPGSENDPTVWAIVLAMAGLPVLVVGLIWAAWRLYHRQRFTLAFAAAGVAGLIALTVLLVPKA